MLFAQAEVLDPSHWSSFGPMGIVSLALFGGMGIMLRWGMNHFDRTSRDWKSAVEKIDENHRLERTEWRESHAREWQELKVDHARERSEWRETLGKAIEAIEASNATTHALHAALKDLPGHLEGKVKEFVGAAR